MRRLLPFLMLLFCCRLAAQDVALFNKDGKAIAYIDTKDKDQTIYLYSGEPVAVISETDVYGFNGKHLGWFEKGIVQDHTGKRIGNTKKAATGYTQYEPYKSYKQQKPYMGYKGYPPYKPYLSNTWSDDSFETFLLQGIDK
ncbi:4-fold beta flower protein [Chitinophaga ginsengisoli]|uniref:4-fold beta flower domain-containing protein n=1 Tax=Chitinophaga ginsengisoli TaxID=363837 RepID=A0A2P8FPP5_9BACT|nr:hypothetical protein [Chitinophaga ginsengisoli]PSL23702.1 hypothetical protein CLV42_11757 [Chitinophaga ginsengisoli]